MNRQLTKILMGLMVHPILNQFEYTVSGNVLTFKCQNRCMVDALASFVLVTGETRLLSANSIQIN